MFIPLIGALAALQEGAGGGRALGSGDPATLASDKREWTRALRACSPSHPERNDIGQWRLIMSSDSAHPRVDPDGVAKGEMADRLYDLMVDVGAGGAPVSAGTSSLATWGTRTSGASWRIGLCDTVKGADDQAGSVPLRGGALSTSGILGGTSCLPSHRIVNPGTGAAPTSTRHPTGILCASGVMAGILLTAILIARTKYINEEALRRQTHRRGVSAEWEWVVTGDSDVQASVDAGWTPRAGPAHEVRRGAARQAEAARSPSIQRRHGQASPSPPGPVTPALGPRRIMVGAATCLAQQRPVVLASQPEGDAQPRRSSREVDVALGPRPTGPGRLDPPDDLSGAQEDRRGRPGGSTYGVHTMVHAVNGVDIDATPGFEH